MRSLFPIPGSPWPHDMTITVQDMPSGLLDLLWIREAAGLSPSDADLPPALVGTDAMPHGSTARTEWAEAWPDLWRRTLAHAATPRDGVADLARLRATPPGGAEHLLALAEIAGPSWREEFGEEGFGDAYELWRTELARHSSDNTRRRLEHTVVDALVPAWRTGLMIVITIPVVGEYWRDAGPHAILMASALRDDPDAYARTLRKFTAARA